MRRRVGITHLTNGGDCSILSGWLLALGMFIRRTVTCPSVLQAASVGSNSKGLFYFAYYHK